MTQPEYYSNGKKMSPTKLIYSIKKKLDDEVLVSKGIKPRKTAAQGDVGSNANYERFN